ncbi:hypothetical protein [Rhodopirellula bahusiensis]|uniref:Uncharacterized protein n=1 Tax=Rhodopirellula bahusiensis TaxID=2014065 RepID=A0A2G1VZ98_9BACT|nr:hypothetical protein [Rhodopirellula bahusiensis]PHQ32102.1 hypothetical protein CEE69_27270 [Rhodopirellula bahusiensis]
MKHALRLLLILALILGGSVLIRLTRENGRLAKEIAQLEAELGRMSIDDADRIYLVEIETPQVPPEVASHVDRVWQFRCYIPPGYDFMRMSGGGRVAENGIYHSGSFGSSGGSPNPEATHELLTISFQKKDNRLVVFDCFGGSAGTTSWHRFNHEQFDDSLVVQKLAASNQRPRSFDQDTILPLLKTYDPSTAEKKEVAGKKFTTYAGGLFVLFPKTRESEFNQLRKGETPSDFDPSRVASEVSDE